MHEPDAPQPDQEPLIIGVDVGGSGLRAHVVQRLPTGRLKLGGLGIEGQWAHRRPFVPLSIEQQLEEHAGGTVEPDPAELLAAEEQTDMLAAAVFELWHSAGGGPLYLGLCLPGLTDAEARGVLVSRHCPRSSSLLDDLAKALEVQGVELAEPLKGIVSDGEAAGWGEELSALGLFSGVQSAYFLGAGSGLAEALKLKGQHMSVTELRQELPAAWSIPCAGGP